MSRKDEVKVELIDKWSLEPLGSWNISKEVLGRIYLMAAELGITAEEVLERSIELALEKFEKK